MNQMSSITSTNHANHPNGSTSNTNTNSSSSSSAAAAATTKNNNNTTTATLSGLFDAEPKSRRTGAATVSGGDDRMRMTTTKRNTNRTSSVAGDGGDVDTSEIYIRPDGKKVRRIKKTILRPSHDTNHTTTATGGGAEEGRGNHHGSHNNTTNTTNTITSSEVYTRPDGKKVRRIIRTKSNIDTNANLGNFLHVDTTTNTNTNNTTNTTFRGSATVSGTEPSSSASEGEIYIRPDGKKVRRVKKSSLSNTNQIHPNHNSCNNNTPILKDPQWSSGSNNSIATTMTNTSLASTTTTNALPHHDGGTTTRSSTTDSDHIMPTTTKSEIYINAEGKKVRRIIKQKTPNETTATTTNQASISTTQSTSTPLSGYLDQPMSPSNNTKSLSSLRGSASVSGSTPSTSKAFGEIYINAQGKKVRRVLKSKPISSNSVSDVRDPHGTMSSQPESIPSTTNQLHTTTTNTTTTSDMTSNNHHHHHHNKSNTIAEGEIYIRADGKKVRRVKRTNSNVIGMSPAATVVLSPVSAAAAATVPILSPTTTSNAILSRPPPAPPTASPLSPLEGFLGKHSPKRTKGVVITGSATVAGDRVSSKIDGGEIYINAQGKKVRRVRKPKPTTPSSTTTMTPTETTIANARTHLGVTQSILLERAAAKIQKAEMEYDKQQQQLQESTAKPTTIFPTAGRPTGEYFNTTPRHWDTTGPTNTDSTNDTLDGPKHTSPLNEINNTTNSSSREESGPEQLSSNDSTNESLSRTNPATTVPTTPETATTPTAPATTIEERSEIYINAEGKKVRRIRRSSSIRSTSSSVENGLPGTGSNRSIGASSHTSSMDGNKSNRSNNNTVNKSSMNAQLGEIYIRPDGKKVRRVRRHQSTDSALALGMFLQDSNGSSKPTLSGSATVVGDRKLDGEIIIRPDGKKVIRRAKSLMASNASTAAGDILSSTPPIGEIFRNADGKLVRRVKRTISKNTDVLNKTTTNETTNNTIEPKVSSETPNTSTNTGLQLTDDEEKIANGYRKMKDMGIPEDAVRHKMKVSEVHPKIIAAVMGDTWSDPGIISASTQLQQAISPTNVVSIQLTNEEEDVAAVYRKMQKMGLPQDAVRHKMIVNEVAPKIVAAVLGDEWKDSGSNISTGTDSPVEPNIQSSSIELTGGEEMIASVYRRLQKMGLSDDAVRHKMVTSNVHPKIIAAVLNEEWIDASKQDEVTQDISNGPSLTSEEETIAAPFRKMQNIGFSKDAVRHKMIMSEVHPKIMAAVLGEPWTDDSHPTAAPITETMSNLTDDEGAMIAQYRRMLKAGIPIDTVRHKMTLEGVDTKLIAKLLRDDSKAPAQVDVVTSTLQKLTDDEELVVAQYKKMRQMGLPDDAIRHKMIVNDVDPKIVLAFFNEEQHSTASNDNAPSASQTAAVSNITSKASGAVAYVVVVGDEESSNNNVPVATITNQSSISLNPEEKFAVKVADEANPDSTTKQTKFFTLDELARLSGQSKSELEAIVKDKRQRGLSPPRFSLQPLQEPTYEVSVPIPSDNTTPLEKATSPPISAKNVTAIKEGQEVVDSDLAKAARAVSALADGDMSKLLEKLKMGDMKDLLEKLYEAEKRQKKLEKQLAQAGVAIAEDIDYQEALSKVGEIAKRMNEIGGSDVVLADKAEQNRLREEYFKLEQEMERYNTALVLSEEYQAEQDRMELKWEADNEPLNIEALKKIRRHMPVNIRNLSEADLTTKPSPNGKYLPVVIAKKFKRTNILQCLRLNPDDLECMHPATLENMRVTGLTLTERRALYIHFKPVGPKWEKNKAEKMTERKWTWYQMMRNNFKENVAPYQRHVDQYGGPENHSCPLLGKQCPIRADKNPDYDGDYGWTEAAEYEVSDVRKADVEDSGAKAKAEALELTKAKKANERADLLKKHYKGKLLQVSKANGSCEGMDEAMDQMENNTFRWTENMLDKADTYTDVDKKKEVANFMDALNEFKLKLLAFAQRSGMQMSGKKTDGGDSSDIRSLVEGSLSEELFEASKELFAFIRLRLKKLDIVDTRCIKTIEMLEVYLNDLHGRNLMLFDSLGVKRMNRSRKLKTNKEIQKDVEEKSKPTEPEPAAEEAPGRPGPPMGGGGRGGLMDAIAGRGRGGGGRGGLLDAISGRGRGGGDSGGGRGGLLDAIAGRGRGGGGRGGLLDAISGRGRGGGDSGGGRGGLLDAIAGRGKGGGRGGDGGGRGGLMAAIAARGGGGD